MKVVSPRLYQIRQRAAADFAAKNTTGGAIKLLSAGYAHLLRGQSGQAAAAADRALQQSTVMAVRFLAAQIFVETAAIEKAQALAAELGKSAEPADDSRVYGKIIEAQIALKKEPVQAIKLLTDANGVWDTWLGHFNLGRAYLEAGRFVEADSEFDLCITRRGEALTVMDEGPSYGIFPIVYDYQGRVREGLKTANFAGSYREYLKIRGESKEDPLVPEVRKRAGNDTPPTHTLTAPAYDAYVRLAARHFAPKIKLRVGRERASPAWTDWSGRGSRPHLVETSAIDKAQTLPQHSPRRRELSDDSRVYGKKPAPHTSH